MYRDTLELGNKSHTIQVLESNTNTQTLEVIHPEGIRIGIHSIGLNRDSEIPFFLEKQKVDIDLPIFTGSINSHWPNNGLATELWKIGEESFYHSQQEPYLRFIYDASDQRWTKRALPYVLEHLENKGIPVTQVWEGKFQVGYDAWLFLFH
jgi:hypothetical protein